MVSAVRAAAKLIAWTVGLLAVGIVVLGVVVPRLFGWNVYAVTSGSMEPTLGVGSVVAVKPVDTDQLDIGDVITYHANGTDELVTHRVVKWSGRGADRVLVTRGDANESVDPVAVPAAAVVGQVQFGVPKVGFVLALLKTPVGIGVAAALVAFALLSGGGGQKPKHVPDSEPASAEPAETRADAVA